ncbi:hypothetical protein [Candidatus Zinderia endosymbiont of Aphrophora alni]|uniref:hypothetical protein n=1 Tax=Candidatus Zinderia endosymbiont of Aphrophora alni TaxID=3077951 RepID=UPI0030CAE413
MYKMYVIITFLQIFSGLIIIILILFENNKNINIYNNKSYLNFLDYDEYYHFYFKLIITIIIIFLLLTITSVYFNNKIFIKNNNN